MSSEDERMNSQDEIECETSKLAESREEGVSERSTERAASTKAENHGEDTKKKENLENTDEGNASSEKGPSWPLGKHKAAKNLKSSNQTSEKPFNSRGDGRIQEAFHGHSTRLRTSSRVKNQKEASKLESKKVLAKISSSSRRQVTMKLKAKSVVDGKRTTGKNVLRTRQQADEGEELNSVVPQGFRYLSQGLVDRAENKPGSKRGEGQILDTLGAFADLALRDEKLPATIRTSKRSVKGTSKSIRHSPGRKKVTVLSKRKVSLSRKQAKSSEPSKEDNSLLGKSDPRSEPDEDEVEERRAKQKGKLESMEAKEHGKMAEGSRRSRGQGSSRGTGSDTAQDDVGDAMAGDGDGGEAMESVSAEEMSDHKQMAAEVVSSAEMQTAAADDGASRREQRAAAASVRRPSFRKQERHFHRPARTPFHTNRPDLRESDSAQAQRLRNALQNSVFKRFIRFEWLYSIPELRHFFATNELVNTVKSLGFPSPEKLDKLTPSEWSHLKMLCGRPRRFSSRFVEQQRARLSSLRRDYAGYCREVQQRQAVITALPDPLQNPLPFPSSLQIGSQFVTTRHPASDRLADGKILAAGSAAGKMMVQFSEALGNHLVDENELMPREPMSNGLRPPVIFLARHSTAERLDSQLGSAVWQEKCLQSLSDYADIVADNLRYLRHLLQSVSAVGDLPSVRYLVGKTFEQSFNCRISRPSRQAILILLARKEKVLTENPPNKEALLQEVDKEAQILFSRIAVLPPCLPPVPNPALNPPAGDGRGSKPACIDGQGQGTETETEGGQKRARLLGKVPASPGQELFPACLYRGRKLVAEGVHNLALSLRVSTPTNGEAPAVPEGKRAGPVEENPLREVKDAMGLVLGLFEGSTTRVEAGDLAELIAACVATLFLVQEPGSNAAEVHCAIQSALAYMRPKSSQDANIGAYKELEEAMNTLMKLILREYKK